LVTAISNDAYFLFPSFAVKSASIASGGQSDRGWTFYPPRPFVDIAGKLNFPDRTYDKKEGLQITIEIYDLLQSDLEAPVLAALKADHPEVVANRVRREPDLDDSWQVTLELLDGAEGGSYVQLGKTWTLDRGNGASSATMKFVIDRDSVEASKLFRASASDLRLRLESLYGVRFSKSDFVLAGNFLDRQVQEIAAAVTAKAGDLQPLLFVPVGGSMKHESNFDALFQRAIDISIEKRAGIDSSAAPDADLVKSFIDKTLESFQAQTKLSEQRSDMVVSFILANGLRFTAPLGEVKKISDSFKTEKERKSSELLESLSKDQLKWGLDVRAKVDVLGVVGVGGSTKFDYDHATEQQRKELREQFTRDLDEASKMVEGTIPTVTTMDLSSFNRMATSAYFKTKLEQGTFTDSRKTFSFRLPVDDAAIRAYPDPGGEFRSAIDSLILLSANGFKDAKIVTSGGYESYAGPQPRECNASGVTRNARGKITGIYFFFCGPDTSIERVRAFHDEFAHKLDAVLPKSWSRTEIVPGNEGVKGMQFGQPDGKVYFQTSVHRSDSSYYVQLDLL
jgi:hypothetical protein